MPACERAREACCTMDAATRFSQLLFQHRHTTRRPMPTLRPQASLSANHVHRGCPQAFRRPDRREMLVPPWSLGSGARKDQPEPLSGAGAAQLPWRRGRVETGVPPPQTASREGAARLGDQHPSMDGAPPARRAREGASAPPWPVAEPQGRCRAPVPRGHPGTLEGPQSYSIFATSAQCEATCRLQQSDCQQCAETKLWCCLLCVFARQGAGDPCRIRWLFTLSTS